MPKPRFPMDGAQPSDPRIRQRLVPARQKQRDATTGPPGAVAKIHRVGKLVRLQLDREVSVLRSHPAGWPKALFFGNRMR